VARRVRGARRAPDPAAPEAGAPVGRAAASARGPAGPHDPAVPLGHAPAARLGHVPALPISPPGAAPGLPTLETSRGDRRQGSARGHRRHGAASDPVRRRARRPASNDRAVRRLRGPNGALIAHHARPARFNRRGQAGPRARHPGPVAAGAHRTATRRLRSAPVPRRHHSRRTRSWSPDAVRSRRHSPPDGRPDGCWSRRSAARRWNGSCSTPRPSGSRSWRSKAAR